MKQCNSLFLCFDFTAVERTDTDIGIYVLLGFDLDLGFI